MVETLPEFTGRGTLADRQQRPGEIFNIAVVITNQAISAPDTFFGDPTKAAGGNIVAHSSTYTIYLRKSGENRLAKIMDSPYLLVRHNEHNSILRCSVFISSNQDV